MNNPDDFKLCNDCCFNDGIYNLVFVLGLDHMDNKVYYAQGENRYFIIGNNSGVGHEEDIILEFPFEPEMEPTNIHSRGIKGEYRSFIHEWEEWSHKFGDSKDLKINLYDSMKLIWALISSGYDPKIDQDWYVYLINYISVNNLPFGSHYERVKVFKESTFKEHIEFSFSSGIADWDVYEEHSGIKIKPGDFVEDIKYRTDDDFNWFYVIFHCLTVEQRVLLWAEWNVYKDSVRDIPLKEYAIVHSPISKVVKEYYEKVCNL